jgi:1,4-dihydroxy-2-naphthoate octaprenyltransferase
VSSESSEAAGPAPEYYLGDSPGQIARRLFNATRPKFFPASVLPVIAGTAWGVSVLGKLDAVVFMLALFATVCVHAGANVLNDVGDDAGGTDRNNDDRIYPYTGGSRFIQSGIMSADNMARLGISLLAMAGIGGLLLLMMRGQMILWFGLAGVILAVLYSLGPVRLSAIGLGETAVGIAFGVLPVVGAAWLQSGVIDLDVFLFSLPISAWVAAILLINEVPDITADASFGKGTLPVRIGLSGTAVVYMSIQLSAVAVVLWMALNGALPLAAPLVPLMLLVLAFKATRAIRSGIAHRASLTAAIEATLGIHTIGSAWLAACALYIVFWGGS